MAKEPSRKPGVMLYFETKHCVKRLDLEDKGRLFDAILAYGENGIIPNFDEETDMSLCIVWDIIKPKIDRDAAAYQEICQQKKNAANARWSKSENA